MRPGWWYRGLQRTGRNASTLTFSTPAANPGQAVVQVINPDGQVATADRVFTYQS